MKQILLKKDNSSSEFLYEQLYKGIKEQIINGDMLPGEKCPSIRNFARSLEVSVTTVMESYNQLLAEGYIYNKPGSGYYVEKVDAKKIEIKESSDEEKINKNRGDVSDNTRLNNKSNYQHITDNESFDFIKWKKCASKVFSEYSEKLLYESDLKGEPELRQELSNYLYRSRGVKADPEDIIIAAGTQQIAFHLGRILKAVSINLIAVEKPGYSPVKSIFSDASFTTSDIPVGSEGIDINLLPVNISSAVYVNPSNQFPTGVVMPATKRYEILKWAEDNKSYIIEDDYNSELRYFGKPMPTIKSLDSNDRVIYLGSFSSILFSAIKISYMVLPDRLSEVFESIKENYSQTCSKAEQLTLARYMQEGYYYTTIRKKRALYAKKLSAVINAFSKYSDKKIRLENTNSGLTVMINIDSEMPGDIFVEHAKKHKAYVTYIKEISDINNKSLSFYYSFLPYEKIDEVICNMLNDWKKLCK